MKNRAKGLGIPTYQLNEPPGFRLGDGKSQVMTPQGPQLTKEGQLYKLKEVKFDIMHLHHKPVTEHLLRLFPQTPVITTIHSEVIELEHPVIDDRISKYICIRPEIKDYITEVFEVEEKKTSVIYNPFDTQRFKPHVKPNNKNKRILFVGTIDYIRQDTILHLIESTKEQGKELWILGKKKSDYLDDLNESHVTYIEPTWDVEKYIKQCDETAGILLGRTTIEGWLCDRPGWIYDVDSSGNISSYKLHEVPEDVDKFKSEKVIEETIKEYIKII
jgi:glycosyltransferase involved in cell wall biosynthesis